MRTATIDGETGNDETSTDHSLASGPGRAPRRPLVMGRAIDRLALPPEPGSVDEQPQL
jgi:hypothetical protein